MVEAILPRRYRDPKPCHLEPDRLRPPRVYDLWTSWGPEDTGTLEPDDPADGELGVTRPVGSFRLPCGPALRTMLCTVYEREPDAETRAIPFRLPQSGLIVWVQHELF